MQLAISRALVFASLACAACAAPGSLPLGASWEGPSCPTDWPSGHPPMDVVIAIDTSRSTRNPTGLDIDGDGRVGEFRGSAWTDRGDSVLAAEVAAVRRLVRLASGSGVRFALVAYAGRQESVLEDSVTQLVHRRDAKLRVPLTDDLAELEAELASIERRGSNGNSSFAPPMRLALRALEHPPDGVRAERAHVLFLSDSPWPIRRAPGGHLAWQDRRMRTHAMRAIKSDIQFDTFGIGSAAEASAPHTLTHIAGATGGAFYAVPDPARLHCYLLGALHEPRRLGSASAVD